MINVTTVLSFINIRDPNFMKWYHKCHDVKSKPNQLSRNLDHDHNLLVANMNTIKSTACTCHPAGINAHHTAVV